MRALRNCLRPGCTRRCYADRWICSPCWIAIGSKRRERLMRLARPATTTRIPSPMSPFWILEARNVLVAAFHLTNKQSSALVCALANLGPVEGFISTPKGVKNA